MLDMVMCTHSCINSTYSPLSSFTGIYVFDVDLQTYPRAVQVGKQAMQD